MDPLQRANDMLAALQEQRNNFANTCVLLQAEKAALLRQVSALDAEKAALHGQIAALSGELAAIRPAPSEPVVKTE
jgi:predicted  nucleic acid-binding Zn-ribbon protein